MRASKSVREQHSSAQLQMERRLCGSNMPRLLCAGVLPALEQRDFHFVLAAHS